MGSASVEASEEHHPRTACAQVPRSQGAARTKEVKQDVDNNNNNIEVVMLDNGESCVNLATGRCARRRSGGTTARSRSRTAQRHGTGRPNTRTAATGNQDEVGGGTARIAPRESSANHVSVILHSLWTCVQIRIVVAHH